MPFNVSPDCSFNPRLPLSLATPRRFRVNEGLMEAALVQRLADLRGTLNYLAAGNLLLPEAPLFKVALAVAARENYALRRC